MVQLLRRSCWAKNSFSTLGRVGTTTIPCQMGAYLKSWLLVCCINSKQFSLAIGGYPENQTSKTINWRWIHLDPQIFPTHHWNVHRVLGIPGCMPFHDLSGMLEFLADLGRLTEVRDPAHHEVANLQEFCTTYGIP